MGKLRQALSSMAKWERARDPQERQRSLDAARLTASEKESSVVDAKAVKKDGKFVKKTRLRKHQRRG